MKSKKPHIIITCEHADFKIPDFVKSKMPSWFTTSLKKSHQTYDQYAIEISMAVKDLLKKQGFTVDLISYPYTRLLIDANRTKDNKGFYSKLSPYITDQELKKIEDRYDAYKKECENLIQKNLKTKDIVLFSVHSFVPVFNGKKRKTDIGLLFRNKISKEKSFAVQLKKELQKEVPMTHLNLPYRGHTDCFLNHILDKYKNNKSVNGLFFEFNQDYLKSELKKKAVILKQALVDTIEKTNDV